MTKYIKAADVQAAYDQLKAGLDQVQTGLNTASRAEVTLGQLIANAIDIADPPVNPPTGGTLPPGVTLGKKSVLIADFSDSANWLVGRTSAFPGSSPQTNPGDNKLDRIWSGSVLSAPSKLADGKTWRFGAARATDGLWDADLVTTEGSGNGFQARVGDELSATVTLYAQQGAWPAIWTWRSEVDCFEYHGDNPNLLELSNHTQNNQGDYYAYASNAITPGKPFTLVTKFKTDGVEWWVDGKMLAKKTGVPANWSAYLIVNMSVSAGKYHPAPGSNQTEVHWDVADLTVWR